MATLGGAALGALAIVASLTHTIPSEIAEGEAFAAGDGGSSFAQRARKGELAPPDIDEVEQMCALLTSCDKLPIPPGLVPQDFAGCVRQMAEDMTKPSGVFFSLTMRECGLTANSCDALRTCALRSAAPAACAGRAVPTKEKPQPDPVGVCDEAGRALTCFNGNILSVRDCSRGGESCQVYSPKDCGKPNPADCAAQSRCTLGPCGDVKEGADAVCSKSGTHILRCERGKLVSLDCDAFGLKCSPLTTAPNSKVGCATGGATCQDGARRCEGNTSVGCYNGHEVRVDCAAAGLACSNTPGSTPIGACVAPAPSEKCNFDKPSCGGAGNAYVQYCYAGKPRSYFCKPRFNKCDKSNGNVKCSN